MEKGRELELKIEQLTQQRDERLTVLQNLLDEFSKVLGEIHNSTQNQEWTSVVNSTCENFSLQSTIMQLTLQKTRLEQQLEERPVDLMNELKESCKNLLKKIDDCEKKLKKLNEIEAKYDALGPKFKDFLLKWTELENKISTKEWSLKELDNMRNSSGLEDSFLNDSFN